MIKNKTSNNQRIAFIDNLDTLLVDYETEYLYLFKVLQDALASEDDDIQSVYHIPNIARKFLETFLMLKIPNTDTSYNKLQKMDFDATKKTKIWKFLNEQSHKTAGGVETSLVPVTKEIIKHIVDMVQNEDPKHYKILKESLLNNSLSPKK